MNEKSFIEEVRKASWWSVYRCEDANEAAEIFTHILTEILDRHAPVKVYQTRTNFAPWLSEETTDSCKSETGPRCGLHHWTGRKTGLTTGSLEIKWLQNWKLTRLIGRRQNWRTNIKGWLNWASSSSPSKLFHEGRIETSSINIASIMNHFYIEKVQNIRENLPEARNDPLEELKKQMKHSNFKLKLKPVHPDLILNIITNLRNSKAAGFDDIDTYVLKI